MGIEEYKTPERIPIFMVIDEKILDQLIAGYKKPEDLIGENGLLKELTRRLLERAMSAEMTEHLGHE